MNLSEYLGVLRDRWKIIVAITLLATAAAGVVTYTMTPRYDARAQVFVAFQPTDPSSTSGLVSGATYTQNQITSYVDLATSPMVLDPVIQELGLPTTPSGLADSLAVTNPADSVLIDVVASSEQPEEAAQIANAVAASIAAVIPDLERPEGADASPVKLTVVRQATPPSSPVSPQVPLNLGFGLVAGLLLGIGAAVLRHALDTKIRSENDIAAVTDAPVIGSIGFDDEAAAHPLIVQTSPHSTRSEAFRRLRTNLQFLDVGSGSRAIVITSAVPGEGKSTTAINLAISLADAGSRVVLVDADLRRPAIAGYMGLEGQVGLTTILIGRASLDDVVQPWGNSRLHIVTSGQIPPNPSELLGSHTMSTLIKELAEAYDVVLLDTAPLLPVTDGAVLARLSAGALVVAGADKVHRAQLDQAIGRLTTVGAHLFGVVLNRVARKDADEYTYYNYSSSDPDKSPAATPLKWSLLEKLRQQDDAVARRKATTPAGIRPRHATPQQRASESSGKRPGVEAASESQ